jgi:hypothetical protein
VKRLEKLKQEENFAFIYDSGQRTALLSALESLELFKRGKALAPSCWTK